MYTIQIVPAMQLSKILGSICKQLFMTVLMQEKSQLRNWQLTMNILCVYISI